MVRFPVIESIHISPDAELGNIKSYLLKAAAGFTFSARVIRAVDMALTAQIPGVHFEFGLGMYEDSWVLTVTTNPRDSYQGEGRYEVYGALRKLFEPQMPYTSLMQPTICREQPIGFDADLLILGHPDKQVLDELELRIRATPGVAHVVQARDTHKPHQFALIVDGEVRQPYEFTVALRRVAGVQTVLILDRLM